MGDLQNGGFSLVSEEGGASPTKNKSRNSGIETITDADMLVSMVGGFSEMELGDASKMRDKWEAIGQLLESFKAGAETADKSKNYLESVAKATEDSKTGIMPDVPKDNGPADKTPKDTICTGGCEGKYHGDFSGTVRNANKDSIGTVPPKN